MDSKKNNVISSAAHYATFLGMFWVFKYIFLIVSEYAGDFYLYIYNVLAIGTVVLFYALASLYRDKRLGGNINFGQIIIFSFFLFLFASLIESVIITVHIMVINPNYLTSLQDQIYTAYQNLGLSDKLMSIVEKGLDFGPLTFIISQIMWNVFSGLAISLIFGYLICMKKNNHSSNH